MDIIELIRLLRAGKSDRAITQMLTYNRRTVVRYRMWASEQGLLTGEHIERHECPVAKVQVDETVKRVGAMKVPLLHNPRCREIRCCMLTTMRWRTAPVRVGASDWAIED